MENIENNQENPITSTQLQLKCKTCGGQIHKNELDYLKSLGFTHTPELCENCRREKRLYRRKCDKVNRVLLEEFDGVRVESVFFKPEELKQTQNRKTIYYPFFFGGSNFGKHWTGARYSEKYMVFIHKSLCEEGAYDLDGKIINIRKMEKQITKKNEENEEGWIEKHEYLTIQPAQTQEVKWYLYYLESYYKTTLKGFGRDRDWRYSYSPADENLPESENLCFPLLEGWTTANTHRFGNNFELVISRNPLKIEYHGVS